jgi:hypothetical protein
MCAYSINKFKQLPAKKVRVYQANYAQYTFQTVSTDDVNIFRKKNPLSSDVSLVLIS